MSQLYTGVFLERLSVLYYLLLSMLPLLLLAMGFHSSVYFISNLKLLRYVGGLLVYLQNTHFFCQWNAAIGFYIGRSLADLQVLNWFVERGQLQSILVIG